MKCYIYLFRHGLTHYNKHGWFTGHIDSRMTEEGLRNSRKIAKKLKRKKIGIAYHSGLKRSKNTLKEVLKYHPECKEIIEDRRIIERCYGKLQKRSHKEFMEEMEVSVSKLIEKRYGKIKREHKRRFAERLAEEIYEIYHRSYDIPPPGGESIKDVEKRVKPFIRDLLRKVKRERVNVAISAHGNSMRPLRKYFEKLSTQEMLELENPYDDYFVYSIKV